MGPKGYKWGARKRKAGYVFPGKGANLELLKEIIPRSGGLLRGLRGRMAKRTVDGNYP